MNPEKSSGILRLLLYLLLSRFSGSSAQCPIDVWWMLLSDSVNGYPEIDTSNVTLIVAGCFQKENQPKAVL